MKIYQLKCCVKSLVLSDMDYVFKENQIKTFTSEQIVNSVSLQNAIKQKWVAILKEAIVNSNSILEDVEQIKKDPSRGRRKSKKKS